MYSHYNPGVIATNYFPIIKLDYFNLSRDPNITIEDVLLLGKPNCWCFDYLTINPGIKIKDILTHRELRWDYNSISLNPNLTIKDVIENPKIRWNYNQLIKNPSITPKDIFDHPELPWTSHVSLTYHPKLTMLDVIEHPNYQWDHGWLTQKKYTAKDYREVIEKVKNVIYKLNIPDDIVGILLEYCDLVPEQYTIKMYQKMYPKSASEK